MSEDHYAYFKKNAWAYANNLTYLEALYETYLTQPHTLESTFYHEFKQEWGKGGSDTLHSQLKRTFIGLTRGKAAKPYCINDSKQSQVSQIITEYRLLGHRIADCDPLKQQPLPYVKELTLEYYGFTQADLEKKFDSGCLTPNQPEYLKTIIGKLKTIYCGTIATEIMHISESEERNWLRARIEKDSLNKVVSVQQKKHILDKLISSETLEKYLAIQYPGAKRFGLEGSESTIVALDELIQRFDEYDGQEVVIGMAHRGRLNVLVNILGKNPAKLCEEFEGKNEIAFQLGDVKYHQGFSSNVRTAKGNMHLSLAFNPSHLESVCPVICGSVRSRCERRQDKHFNTVLPILIHGDASFSGQGVVMETLNMSQTRGFRVGGVVHIIINNQIGFTTSEPDDLRSTVYCSDLAKMLQAPIFHVNGDDPEAVCIVTQIALDYRLKFKKDVFIEIVGYRRYGHNEADEPSVTQPRMYETIRSHPTVVSLYSKQLLKEKICFQKEIDTLISSYREKLENRQAILISNAVSDWVPPFQADWSKHKGTQWQEAIDTGVPWQILKTIAHKRDTCPEGFLLHPIVKKMIDARIEMTEDKKPIDWGYGETLAYATLLVEGYAVRLSGEDCARGTFFHRHVEWIEQATGQSYISLQHLDHKQAPFSVINSLLSEAAVLGFEYGYASNNPNTLVIWEAQFGDFANGAQVLIDQFISSGEHKWGRLNHLTLFLPHGYEGQGPEHSSARIERYLQLCAESNIQVCIPTTPVQMFHLLRRQMLRAMRKPLIVMTPKSLLRHPLAVSKIEDFTKGHYSVILPEVDPMEPEWITRVLLCSGKVYYDLLTERRKQDISTIAIIRLEQLYPFPSEALIAKLQCYPYAKEVCWVQEEPINQGAWYALQSHFRMCLQFQQTLEKVAREASSAPSVGYARRHHQQQAELVRTALTQGER